MSGLPWSLLGVETQRRILDEITEVLEPSGAFSTFAYVHALPLSRARSFHRSLEERFDQVSVSRTVWRNLPPAVAYICHRPKK